MTEQKARLEGLEGEQVAAEALEADAVTLHQSAVASAKANELRADWSALGVASADSKAKASRSWVGVLAANGEAELEQGYASVVLSAGDVEMEQAGAELVIAGGDVTMERAAALAVGGRSVTVTSGWVGIVAAPEAQLAEGVRVAFGRREAIVFGAVFGAVFAALVVLFTGRRRG
jgi:hypothetical protein